MMVARWCALIEQLPTLLDVAPVASLRHSPLCCLVVTLVVVVVIVATPTIDSAPLAPVSNQRRVRRDGAMV